MSDLTDRGRRHLEAIQIDPPAWHAQFSILIRELCDALEAFERELDETDANYQGTVMALRSAHAEAEQRAELAEEQRERYLASSVREEQRADWAEAAHADMRDQLIRCGTIAITDRQDGTLSKTSAAQIRAIVAKTCWPENTE